MIITKTISIILLRTDLSRNFSNFRISISTPWQIRNYPISQSQGIPTWQCKCGWNERKKNDVGKKMKFSKSRVKLLQKIHHTRQIGIPLKRTVHLFDVGAASRASNWTVSSDTQCSKLEQHFISSKTSSSSLIIYRWWNVLINLSQEI